ncbi:MAG TPA: hypothetical protein VMF58_18320 [Rhizomicrobium sp.]|nr:hypothetical protein [Rhizomicrobium sp.]
MTRFLALSFACVAMVAAAMPARADATAKQFLQLDSSDDGVTLAETKITAIEEGIRITNARLPAGSRLYCQPSTLVFTGSQLADMVHRAVAANDKLEDDPVSSVLLDTLEKTFPCTAPAH